MAARSPVKTGATEPETRAITKTSSRDERIAAGKALRTPLPREQHAVLKIPARRRDAVGIVMQSNRQRVQQLVPVRHGRMLRSPFTFLRGSAGLMAYDLATTPTTGIRVQACGDCHLLNFGLFATPERNLVFDINDFDETLPAPWEWDVKRLAASVVVAGRDTEVRDKPTRGRPRSTVCVRTVKTCAIRQHEPARSLVRPHRTRRR